MVSDSRPDCSANRPVFSPSSLPRSRFPKEPQSIDAVTNVMSDHGHQGESDRIRSTSETLWNRGQTTSFSLLISHKHFLPRLSLTIISAAKDGQQIRRQKCPHMGFPTALQCRLNRLAARKPKPGNSRRLDRTRHHELRTSVNSNCSDFTDIADDADYIQLPKTVNMVSNVAISQFARDTRIPAIVRKSPVSFRL